MRTTVLCTLAVCVWAWTMEARAQTAAPSAGSNPMATKLRGAYTNNRNYLSRAAEKMPEESYGLRPGAQMEVQTFGQIVGPLANFNFLVLASVPGRM